MLKVGPLDSQHSAIQIMQKQPKFIQNTFPHQQTTKVCKICLEEEITSLDILTGMSETQENDIQMLVPCECSGSMAYVHQKCIRIWIQKQLLGSMDREVNCQICKTKLYFALRKNSYWECQFRHLSLISGCNIGTTAVLLLLLILSLLILKYSPNILQSQMFKYLIVLICFLALAVIISVLLMFGQAFVKNERQISKIFSFQESLNLGLRPRKKLSSSSFSKVAEISSFELQLLAQSRLQLRFRNNQPKSTSQQPRAMNHNIAQGSRLRTAEKKKITNKIIVSNNSPIQPPIPFMKLDPSIYGHIL